MFVYSVSLSNHGCRGSTRNINIESFVVVDQMKRCSSILTRKHRSHGSDADRK